MLSFLIYFAATCGLALLAFQAYQHWYLPG
jgi:hypothetical protein